MAASSFRSIPLDQLPPHIAAQPQCAAWLQQVPAHAHEWSVFCITAGEEERCVAVVGDFHDNPQVFGGSLHAAVTALPHLANWDLYNYFFPEEEDVALQSPHLMLIDAPGAAAGKDDQHRFVGSEAIRYVGDDICYVAGDRRQTLWVRLRGDHLPRRYASVLCRVAVEGTVTSVDDSVDGGDCEGAWQACELVLCAPRGDDDPCTVELRLHPPLVRWVTWHTVLDYKVLCLRMPAVAVAAPGGQGGTQPPLPLIARADRVLLSPSYIEHAPCMDRWHTHRCNYYGDVQVVFGVDVRMRGDNPLQPDAVRRATAFLLARAHTAARRIQRAWRRAVTCPEYALCRRRLLSEHAELACGV